MKEIESSPREEPPGKRPMDEPRFTFTHRRAASAEESVAGDTLFGVTSLQHLMEEIDKGFAAPKAAPKRRK